MSREEDALTPGPSPATIFDGARGEGREGGGTAGGRNGKDAGARKRHFVNKGRWNWKIAELLTKKETRR